jgi:predicted anti-sigma-YlaC factor YlaD
VKHTAAALALAATSLFVAGCGAAASKVVADVFAEQGAKPGGTYARDDDPELVGAAVPFGLKTMEGLLADQPEHQGLLLALVSGFTQFGYAFVQAEADELELDGKSVQARPIRVRAKKLFVRARDYGLRGLDLRHAGTAEKLRGARDLASAVAPLNKEDVPLVYWTAASWALAIAAGKEDVALVAQLPSPGALAERALALDETFDEGAIHEFFISWEAARGGDGLRRAKEHLDRALALSHGKKLGPIVAYAEAVSVVRQDCTEFTRLLQAVVAADVEADPPHRLANVLAQRRARLLLLHADDLFS